MHLERHWLSAVGFTAALILLIAAAAIAAFDYFVLIMLVVMILAVAFFYLSFPGSHFFSIALADFLAIYMSLFVFFVETNFPAAHGWAIYVSFALPVLAFLGGAWLRRDEIRAIVTAHRVREERRFGRVLLWLLPVGIIGGSTFLLPGSRLTAAGDDVPLLVAMAAISVVVGVVSRDVATFLVDTGLLFEEFFHRVRRLLVPAFAFMTFYSLLVIVFACLYRVFDRVSLAPLFEINGEARDISFAESLYFSIVTLSTVGYGDILPLSDFVRAVVAVEVVLGVLLLLFGFSEIIGYVRGHRRDED